MNQNKKAPVALEPQKIFSSLRLMIDQEYIFKGQRIKIIDVSEVENGYYIMTSHKNYTMTLDNANSFIAECYPVEGIQPQQSLATQVQPASRQEGMIDDMTEALYESFQNIRSLPTKENIEQATALSNTANTISNMLKLKLQAQKIIGKSKV